MKTKICLIPSKFLIKEKPNLRETEALGSCQMTSGSFLWQEATKVHKGSHPLVPLLLLNGEKVLLSETRPNLPWAGAKVLKKSVWAHAFHILVFSLHFSSAASRRPLPALTRPPGLPILSHLEWRHRTRGQGALYLSSPAFLSVWKSPARTQKPPQGHLKSVTRRVVEASRCTRGGLGLLLGKIYSWKG